MNAPVTTPRETPILFTGPMVRAIFDGSKTITRRLVKPASRWHHVEVDERGDTPVPMVDREPDVIGGNWNELPCPHGVPGDRIWVRETWSIASGNGRRVVYRADLGTDRWPSNVLVPSDGAKVWKPSIHIRRTDARLSLEVTSVRLERLQDITEEDARAEGVTPLDVAADQRIAGDEHQRTQGTHPHVLAFAVLWDGINGKRAAWASNQYVWAIEFRRLP